MNNSQFDEIVERRGTNCAKWDTFDVLLGGEKDLIHVGCADMDFKAPEPILKEFHRLADHGVFGYSDIFDDFIALSNAFIATIIMSLSSMSIWFFALVLT